MASTNEIRRNNIRAGAFTCICLVLGFVVLVVLNSKAMSYLFGSHNSYIIVFNLQDGVAGLTEGSEVRLGGLINGRVTDVRLTGLLEETKTETSTSTAKTDQDTPAEKHAEPQLEVTIEVDKGVRLWSNAVAVRTPPVLGTNAWINISTIGGPDANTACPTELNGAKAVLLPETGSNFPATPGDGLLSTIVGSTNASTTQDILNNIAQFTGFLDGPVIEVFNQQIEPSLADAREIVGNVRSDYGGWSKEVTGTLENVQSASSHLDEVMDEGLNTLKDARSTVQTISSLVSENREHIQQIVTNIDTMTVDGVAITNTIRNKTMAQVDQALESGTDALADLANILNTLDLEVTASIPTIRNFLQDALIAAGELKLTTIEVRRSPWRLLYTPKPGELSHENLFAAARGFTIAASDIRSAAESFQAILDRFPKALEDDPALRNDMEQYLADSLKRFHAAQERLFSVIIDQK